MHGSSEAFHVGGGFHHHDAECATGHFRVDGALLEGGTQGHGLLHGGTEHLRYTANALHEGGDVALGGIGRCAHLVECGADLSEGFANILIAGLLVCQCDFAEDGGYFFRSALEGIAQGDVGLVDRFGEVADFFFCQPHTATDFSNLQQLLGRGASVDTLQRVF